MCGMRLANTYPIAKDRCLCICPLGY